MRVNVLAFVVVHEAVLAEHGGLVRGHAQAINFATSPHKLACCVLHAICVSKPLCSDVLFGSYSTCRFKKMDWKLDVGYQAVCC